MSNSSPLLHQTVYNSIFNGLGTISNFIVAFVFAGLTIRYLGEARSGYLITLQALLALNGLVGDFGVGTAAVRQIAILHSQDELKASRKLLGSVLTLNLSTGLSFAVAIIVFFRFVFSWSRLDGQFESDAFWATLIICVSFFVGRFSTSCQTCYTALQRYELITLTTTIFGLLGCIVGVVVLNVRPSMTAFAAAGLLVGLVRLTIDAWLTGKLIDGIPAPTWSWEQIRPIIRFGSWAYLSTIGGILFTSIDRLLLTTFLGSATVPFYAIPQRLFLQIHGALISQSSFMFPMFSSFGGEASLQIERVEDRLRWFTALLAAGIYSGLAFVGPNLMGLLVNPDFGRSVTAPMILVCVQGFFHAQMIVPYYTSWSVSAGAPNTVAQLGNGMLVIVSAYLLIPHFGYVGVSFAQLWILVIFFLHSSWVNHILYKGRHRWTWLKVYLSPTVLLSVCMFSFEVGKHLGSDGLITQFLALVLGVCGGLALVWLVEQRLLREYGRWDTLMRALAVPMRCIKNIGFKWMVRI
jgi:O-antigen/teichoic acid export membrane protein